MAKLKKSKNKGLKEKRKNKTFCENCLNFTKYRLETQLKKTRVKGVTVEYTKEYALCTKCNKEMFLKNLKGRNQQNIEAAYYLKVKYD